MSSDNNDFDPITDIDPNVWYHLSEFRVDTYDNTPWNSNFHVNGDGELRVFGILEKQTWQFHPLDVPGRYSLRHSFFGIYKQLAVCYEPTEASVGKTKPCLLDSVPDEEAQMWDVSDFGGGMARFINVKNGTGYWLDVHKGNPPFMSSDTDTSADNPGQRWLYTSVSKVNDASFSTVFSAEGSKPSTPRTRISSSTTSSGPPEGTSDRDNSESTSTSTSTDAEAASTALSPGATAGIGAGAGLAILALGILIFWLIRRKKARRGQEQLHEAPDNGGGFAPVPEKTVSPAWSHDQQQMYFQQPNGAYDPQQQQQQHTGTYDPQQQQSTGAYDPHQQQQGAHNEPHQLHTSERPQELGDGQTPHEMATVRY